MEPPITRFDKDPGTDLPLEPDPVGKQKKGGLRWMINDCKMELSQDCVGFHIFFEAFKCVFLVCLFVFETSYEDVFASKNPAVF